MERTDSNSYRYVKRRKRLFTVKRQTKKMSTKSNQQDAEKSTMAAPPRKRQKKALAETNEFRKEPDSPPVRINVDLLRNYCQEAGSIRKGCLPNVLEFRQEPDSPPVRLNGDLLRKLCQEDEIRKGCPPNVPPADVAGTSTATPSVVPRHEIQVYNSVFRPDQCQTTTKGKIRNEVVREKSKCSRSLVNEKLFPDLRELNQKGDPKKWSIDQVSDFVRAIPGCTPSIADRFREEEIDGDAMWLLTEYDIFRLMNIRLGPGLKIFNAILHLKHQKFD